METYYSAMDILDKNESLRGRANLYKYIGDAQYAQRDFEQANKFYNMSLDLCQNTGDKNLESDVVMSLGVMYEGMGELEQALDQYQSSFEIAQQIGNPLFQLNALSNMGNCFSQQGNIEKALEYQYRGLGMAKKLNMPKRIGNISISIAGLELKKENFREAEKLAQTGYTLAEQYAAYPELEKASLVLYNAFKSRGKYDQALEMYETHIGYKDSIRNELNQRAVIKQQFKYDYEKQKEIDDLENAKVVALETQRRKNQQRFSVFTGLALILALYVTYFIFNKLKLTREQKKIIEEQKVKVEQSEKYKEQFLANMSHEIRTPMHAISGMVKILQRNDPPPKQEVYLDAMSKSADNLVVILNDVLDISKIEAGKLDIQSIPINPREVIENAIQILNFKAEEKGLELSYSMEDSVPELVMGDPTRLHQILVNLLGNAVKFTETGQVDLQLELVDQKLSFTVKDTGIGIPEDKLNTIFGAFEQIKSDNGYSKGGTGLGLNITQQLVRLQGGEISVDSEVGEGTTFFFSLPYIAVEQAVHKAEVWNDSILVERAGSLAGIRILLAEDNAFNQMIAKDDLNYYIQDLQLTVVENGVDALERYTTEDFDIILMDVQMPGMNGFEATRAIREYERQGEGRRSVPIIAMTASLLKSEIQKCLDAGMNNYIPKPYTLNELIGTIHGEFQIMISEIS